MFPALGVLSYRTTLIQNRGDLPLTFCLDPSSDSALAKAVSIVPSCGLIAPGCHQILTVKTTPKEDSPKQGFSVYFRLNATKNTKVLYGLCRKTEEQSSHMFCTQLNLRVCLLCPLGTKSCQCCGKVVCDPGRGWQLVLPANSCMVSDAAVPPHQEPQSPTSAVSWQSSF